MLHKTYTFRRLDDREVFIANLFSYERQVQHHAEITIDHDTVTVVLSTRDLDKITEIDKEYASFCDHMFKDIAYLPDAIDV